MGSSQKHLNSHYEFVNYNLINHFILVYRKLLAGIVKHHFAFAIKVKLVLRDHTKQDIYLAFKTDGCLLLQERSAENAFIQQ